MLTVLDFNEHRKDTSLGAAIFEMNRLNEDATLEGVEMPILKDGKDRGQIRFDVSYYPVLKPQIVDGQERLPETSLYKIRDLNYPTQPPFRRWHHSFDSSPSQGARCIEVALWRTESFRESLS